MLYRICKRMIDRLTADQYRELTQLLAQQDKQ